MPRRTTTVTLGDELDRLQSEKERLAGQAAEYPADVQPGDNDAYDDLLAEASEVQDALAALDWAVDGTGDPDHDGWGRDAEVVVGALTTGERGELRDRVGAAASDRVGFGDSGNAEGIAQVFYCAKGLLEAPFLDPGADFEDRAAAVRDLPPQFTDWIEAEIADVTAIGGGGNDWEDLVAAHRTDSETSTTTTQS